MIKSLFSSVAITLLLYAPYVYTNGIDNLHVIDYVCIVLFFCVIFWISSELSKKNN
jgi:hypothetical protein